MLKSASKNDRENGRLLFVPLTESRTPKFATLLQSATGKYPPKVSPRAVVPFIVMVVAVWV